MNRVSLFILLSILSLCLASLGMGQSLSVISASDTEAKIRQVYDDIVAQTDFIETKAYKVYPEGKEKYLDYREFSSKKKGIKVKITKIREKAYNANGEFGGYRTIGLKWETFTLEVK